LAILVATFLVLTEFEGDKDEAVGARRLDVVGEGE
jgi:hypothetical protein